MGLYAAAVVGGGPAIVMTKGSSIEAALRVALAAAALLGIALLAAGTRGRRRALFGLAAIACAVRLAAAVTGGPGRVPVALAEGAEMACVALGLALWVPRGWTRRALGALAVGALALKVAWAAEMVAVVRWGGLALAPLALFALTGTFRAIHEGAPPRGSAAG
ncbi:MAG: hypothetical protein CMN30_06545 [Sandaracinus sp.]|nr:hypothetical protein [Sandaracinus sp.]